MRTGKVGLVMFILCLNHFVFSQNTNLNSRILNSMRGVENKSIQTTSCDTAIFIADGVCEANQCYGIDMPMFNANYNEVIDDVEDILSICVNIEHSYVGDLSFSLYCPNGAHIDLFVTTDSLQHGGAFLGMPNLNDGADACDSSQNPQGRGWNYCWSQQSNYSYQGNLHDLSYGSSPIDSTNRMNNSNYIVPQQSFNGLIGCPIDGYWGLQVCDKWEHNENGYLFSWSMTLNPTTVNLRDSVDGGVTEIMTPSDSVLVNTNSDVNIQIHNFDNFFLDTIPVAYTINGGSEVVEVSVGVITPYWHNDYLFNMPFHPTSTGVYTLCAYTKLYHDKDSTNDMFCKEIVVYGDTNNVGIANSESVDFSIEQNFPNPFSSQTYIGFSVPIPDEVLLKVQNVLGQEVYFQKISASEGKNKFLLKTSNLKSGIYYYSLEYQDKRLAKRMIIQ